VAVRSSAIRGKDATVQETEWGSQQWLVSAENGASQKMTFGRSTFKPGRSNPRHQHPNCEEVLYVVAGEIEHTLPEGGTVRLRAGDCIVIPAGKAHQAKNVGEDEAVILVAFNSAERKMVIE
jgi:quercetin dioxygenase-like cupin family protein